MNRRGMLKAALAALASIPCVGFSFPAAANTHTLADLGRVITARNLLLPALRAIDGQTPDVDFDLQITETASLLVTGHNPYLQRVLGFVITKQSILDDRYKAEFSPSVARLVLVLTNTAAADYDRLFGSEAYAPRNWKRCHGLS